MDLSDTPWSAARINIPMRDEWFETAQAVLAIPGNVCLIGDTGTGKTPTAFLIHLVKSARTLFLTPTKVLAIQQHRSYVEFTDSAEDAQLLLGSTPKARRVWKSGLRMSVSTPHTFWSDWREQKIGDIRQFELIILDECHKARGKYPYAMIAKVAHDYAVPILGLTASPGDSESQIAELFETCHFDDYHLLEVNMPPKYEDRILATFTPALADIETHLLKLLARSVSDLVALGIKVSDLCPGMRELMTVRREKMPPCDFFNQKSKRMWIAWARAVIVRYGLSAVLLESYDTFLQYALELEAAIANWPERRLRESARGQIQASPDWQSAVAIAEANTASHPKLEALQKLALGLTGQRKNALVFVGNQDTAIILAKMLGEFGIRSAPIIGGWSGKTQQAVLDRLRARELDLVVATSVVEEGINVPAMDAVIHYSQPVMGIQRIQRSGRTGRNKPGEVIYILLDHPFDRAAYWGIRRKELAMRELLGRRPQTFQRHAYRELPLFDHPPTR